LISVVDFVYRNWISKSKSLFNLLR